MNRRGAIAGLGALGPQQGQMDHLRRPYATAHLSAWSGETRANSDAAHVAEDD